MSRVHTKSNAQFQKAIKRLPLGVSSNFRYWGEDKTIYAKRGKGGRLWDIDDNEYIDYRLGYGPAILGYADERVDQAARDGMNVGGVFALSTELEYTVADRICKMVSSAELVRFSISGTEAVMAALRLARAYSGKDEYVLVEGGYHGVFSEGLWYSEVEDWKVSEGDPELMPYSEGVPELYGHLIHSVPLNDANRVERLFQRHAGKIAAFLIEPMMGNCCSITAEQQYLKDVRELCTKYDVILIIDEVKTGFRVAKGGVQELLGVDADLSTFAKSMANGYPISALVGQEEIMRMIGNGVVHGGTYTAHSVSIAAANKTLEILDETPALANIAEYGIKLRDGLDKILSRRGIPHCFVGHPAMSGMFFSATPPSNYRDWVKTDYTFYDTLAPNLHDLGILVEPDSREPWFMCEAHDDKCFDETILKFEQAVDITIEQLQHTTNNPVQKVN
ncbi:MAG: glutamate-1-semialdehyde 2,1-aminomutase [Gammaproteobacteria bacterium]|jgi:glutamate-1-semialdehyde 2,1-aminomutase